MAIPEEPVDEVGAELAAGAGQEDSHGSRTTSLIRVFGTILAFALEEARGTPEFLDSADLPADGWDAWVTRRWGRRRHRMAEAIMDIRDVPVDDLVLDPNLNLRDRLDDFTVERYADAWDRLPPVTVFEVDGRWLLADGFHRHAAAVKLGRRTMPGRDPRRDVQRRARLRRGRQPVPRAPADPGRASTGRRGQAPAPSRLVRPPARPRSWVPAAS